MKHDSPLGKNIKKRILRANTTLPREDYLFPLYIIIEPTNICNLSCTMCPSSRQTRQRGVMDIAVWKKIIDETHVKSPDTVIWPAIMGESLIAGERFLEMLEYACSRELRVIWNTNAVLLDAGLTKRVMSMGIQEIIVGIDAATSETYDKIRCGGDFDKVLTNVQNMLDLKTGRTRITVQFIVQKENNDELDAFKEFWLTKGAVVKIRPRLGWGDGVETPELILGQEERVGPCPWLIRTVSIHWNGIVVQCDGDWDQKNPAGNITYNTLEEIWNGELARRRQKHRQNDFNFEPCKNCKDWQAGLSDFFYPGK